MLYTKEVRSINPVGVSGLKWRQIKEEKEQDIYTLSEPLKPKKL
ncbi:hypothetical protein [Vibrio sp. ES.051]|nr:hypothetical protein [Vibrio sp. ES.051]